MPRRLPLRIFVALGLLLSSLTMASSTAHAALLCNGQKPTITSSANVVAGTSRADVILIRGLGKHTVNAGDGNDIICGSSGDDTINAGIGNDVINDGSGSDVINSGDGNDIVNAGDGNDIVTADSGDDTIDSGSGNDSVAGNSGNDALTGGSGNDSLNASAGIDRVNGGDGNDIILGGDGNDRLDGQSGVDTVKGESGDDTLQGGTGRDVLSPGSGANVCASDSVDSIIGTCQIDAQSPTKPTVNIPATVEAGSTLTVMWSVSDQSGIDGSWMNIGGKDGWVTQWCGFAIAGTALQTTGQQHTFVVNCAVPSTAVNGQYSVWLTAVDFFGNRSEATATFDVTQGVLDVAAPIISNLQVSGPVAQGGSATITWRAQDESGVSSTFPWLMSDISGFGFAGTQGAYADYGNYDVTLLDGDSKDGRYQVTVKFNSFAPLGTYTIWMGTRDIYGNREFFTTNVKVTLTS